MPAGAGPEIQVSGRILHLALTRLTSANNYGEERYTPSNWLTSHLRNYVSKRKLSVGSEGCTTYRSL